MQDHAAVLAKSTAGAVAVLAFVTLGVLMDGSLKILPLYSGDARGYGQVALLCLVIVAGLVKWLSPLAWLPSLGIGALLALAYLGFEKKRGVI